MLFLYRPNQTRVPVYIPRPVTEQGVYNQRMHDSFEATRRVPRYVPNRSAEPADHLAALAELHTAGVLSDAEFEAAKARLTARGPSS